MTVLEKIKRCVSLVWDFQEFYGEEDIEDFCCNELDTYTKHSEILDYFKRIADLEKENAELKEKLKPENCLKLLAKEGYIKFTSDQLTKAKEIIKNLLSAYTTYADSFDDRDNEIVGEAEQFISEVEK